MVEPFYKSTIIRMKKLHHFFCYKLKDTHRADADVKAKEDEIT